MNGQGSRNSVVEDDDTEAGPSSSSSSSAAGKRGERMKRLRELHLRRVWSSLYCRNCKDCNIFSALAISDNLSLIFVLQNEARKLNHQEVAEEDRRKKLPANWEATQRRIEWENKEEEARKVNELYWRSLMTDIAQKSSCVY